MANLRNFNKTCPVCSGQGTFIAPDQFETDCPVCLMEYKNQKLLLALNEISGFGIGRINQTMLRAMNAETIGIADRAIRNYNTFGEFRKIIHRIHITKAGSDEKAESQDLP